MKIKHIFLALAAVLILTAPSQARKPKVPAEVTLSKEVLKDKIKGAWAGQIIGCSYGGPTEFKYSNFIPDEYTIDWNEHLIKWWYDHVPGLYDDVYMDLTFVEVFDKEGLDAPVESFAKAFANAGYPLWHANLQARYNILHDIMPPASGDWRYNAHADDIDFQIEADYAGIMAPGLINAATSYTDEIGHIMNYGDGWYGGVYVAAMYALAFVTDDIPFMIEQSQPGAQTRICSADVFCIDLMTIEFFYDICGNTGMIDDGNKSRSQFNIGNVFGNVSAHASMNLGNTAGISACRYILSERISLDIYKNSSDYYNAHSGISFCLICHLL